MSLIHSHSLDICEGMLSSLLTFESEDLGKAVPEANFDGMGKAVSQVNSAQQKPEGLGSTTAPVQIQLTSLNEVSRLLKGLITLIPMLYHYVQL
jgi:hypothetical protein